MQCKGFTVLLAIILAQAPAPQLFAQDDLSGTPKQPRYRLVDLGTFGGPVSLVTGGNGDLNQKKTLVTSCAATSALDPEWPNLNPWNGDEPHIYHAFRTRGGPLQDLGALPGGTTSCGQGISSNGTVAGFSTTGQIDPLTGYREIHATRWQDGAILDLGTLGGNESAANFINDRGQIAGFALNAIPDAFATEFFIGATQVRAFLWEHGTMQDLGTLGGSDSAGYYINELGDVAGQSFTNNIPNETTGIPTLNPFLWHHGTMLDLGTLGGTMKSKTWKSAVARRTDPASRDGVKHSYGAQDDPTHHKQPRYRLVELGTFGGPLGTVGGLSGELSRRRALVASCTDTAFPDPNYPNINPFFGSDPFIQHASRWKDGVLSDLGGLSGGTSSCATAISNQEVIVALQCRHNL